MSVARISDMLPAGVTPIPGGVITSAVARRDVALVAAVVGQTVTASLTLTYATSLTAGASANAMLDNVVVVDAASRAGGPPAAGTASATVQVVASTFGSCYPITGRVYDDAGHSGRFERGDEGLAGVRLVLDDGESVLTDANGLYDFPCVRPGMHALRLDEQTLPPGSVPYPDRAIDSERSTRRLIHRTFDDTTIQDVNFAIGR